MVLWQLAATFKTMQILPSIELAGIIKHYLFLDSKKVDGKNLRLFSDGNTGLVLTTKKDLSLVVNNNNGFENLPNSFLYGQITQFRDILLLNDISLIIVVFQPTGIKKLLQIPANDLRNYIVAIKDILGNRAPEIEEQLATAKTTHERVNLLNTFFISLLYKSNHEKEQVISASINFILKNKGLTTVNDLVKFTGYTERHLERKFMEYVGISPKSFSSIIKLHHFLQVLRSKTADNNLTRIAYDAGYADQSHLIKEFKKYTGITPGSYINKANKLAVNLVALPNAVELSHQGHHVGFVQFSN